jgi:hypothetical protein
MMDGPLAADQPLTILDSWIVAALERSATLTPSQLAEALQLPRDMIVEALIGLAERGLIVDGSPDVADEGEMDSARTWSADRLDRDAEAR